MSSETLPAVPSQLFDVEGAQQKMREWEQVKAKILVKSDIVQRDDNNVQIKRSGWDKLALAANVSTQVVDIWTEKEDEWRPTDVVGDFTARVTMRATTSWGRSAENVGVYSASEFVDKKGNRLAISRHNIIARATTRAHNRAISDLIGGGEVSAEEIEYGADSHKEDSSASKEVENSHKRNAEVSINTFLDLLTTHITAGVVEVTDDEQYVYVTREKGAIDYKIISEIKKLLEPYNPIVDEAARRWMIPKP